MELAAQKDGVTLHHRHLMKRQASQIRVVRALPQCQHPMALICKGCLHRLPVRLEKLEQVGHVFHCTLLQFSANVVLVQTLQTAISWKGKHK